MSRKPAPDRPSTSYDEVVSVHVYLESARTMDGYRYEVLVCRGSDGLVLRRHTSRGSLSADEAIDGATAVASNALVEEVGRWLQVALW